MAFAPTVEVKKKIKIADKQKNHARYVWLPGELLAKIGFLSVF